MPKADVYLIDASIFVFRAYYSMDYSITSKTGVPINAVHGFTRFLIQFIQQVKPKFIACAFDESLDNSYRKEIDPNYKANREPAPAELKHQFKLCQEVCKVLGVKTYVDGYYEADDIIGTLAHKHRKKGHRIHIVSADKDLAQLLKMDDTWWDYGKSKPLSSQDIHIKFGVKPFQIADFLALTGDAVDNIKGVPGIGKKTAAFLLNHFETLEEIIKRHHEITYLTFRGAKSCQKNLAKNIETVILAKKLTEIVHNMPLDEHCLTRTTVDESRIGALFDYLKFGPLLRKNIIDLKKY